MNPRIRVLLAKGQLPLRADERVEIRKTSCPLDGKLLLKADESQVG